MGKGFKGRNKGKLYLYYIVLYDIELPVYIWVYIYAPVCVRCVSGSLYTNWVKNYKKLTFAILCERVFTSNGALFRLLKLKNENPIKSNLELG